MVERLLRPEEASSYLFEHHGIRRTVRTLAKERHAGNGPAFRLIGSRAIGYDPPALDQYAEKLISKQAFTSTVQAKATRRAAEKVA
jgi:hypothetical protein